MKKIKKIAGRGLEIFIIILVLAVWLYSGFKILNYLHPISSAGAFLEEPPLPPDPPEPPCPPFCCLTPTPTPLIEPTPTPTPGEPTGTPTPEVPTPTPTPTGVVLHPPGVGGPPAGGGGEPWTCNATIPPAPTLLTVNSAGLGQANLAWSAVDPVTHYAIVYGLFSGNYIYGVADTGKTTSFTVGGLDSAAKYCFAVRAVNGCAPGGLSNEICQGAVGGGRVLGASTLGATGSATEQLFQIFYIIGCVCLAFGIKLCGVAKKLA